jgi:hypothetical protein
MSFFTARSGFFPVMKLQRSIRGVNPKRAAYEQDAEKDPACRLLKNAQIQGARNPEE